MTRVYRVQDSEGRGPWRPGFSMTWMDDDVADRQASLPSIIEEFGMEALEKAFSSGRYHATACRSMDELRNWFTPEEMRRLASFRFSIVEIRDADIVLQGERQAVIARDRPMAVGVQLRRWP